MNTVIGALVYRGIPSNLRSRLEQSHHLPGALLHDDYSESIGSRMGVPTLNSTGKALKFTIYDYILRLWPKKGEIFYKINSLDEEFIYLATSAECTGSIYRPTAVKEHIDKLF